MIQLSDSLLAWQTDAFDRVLKSELASIHPSQLPLQAAISQGSHVAETEDLNVMIINSRDTTRAIEVKIGIFFSSVIAGCACADDPTPMDLCTEYCVAQLSINKQNGVARIDLINE